MWSRGKHTPSEALASESAAVVDVGHEDQLNALDAAMYENESVLTVRCSERSFAVVRHPSAGANVVIVPSSDVSFIYEQYRIVFALDVTFSMMSYTCSTTGTYFDTLLPQIEAVLRELMAPIYTPGATDLIYEPEIVITVLAYGTTLRVLLQGYRISRTNIDHVVATLKSELLKMEKDIVDYKRDGRRSGRNSMQNMLEHSRFALSLLPREACPAVVVFTDGVAASPSALDYDNLLMRMVREDTAVHVVCVGDQDFYNQPFGQLPDYENLIYMTRYTGGSFRVARNLTCQSFDQCPNELQRSLLWKSSSFCADTKEIPSLHAAEEERVAKLNMIHSVMCIDNPFPWKGPPPKVPVVTKRVMEYRLSVDFVRILECRIREGFIVKGHSVETGLMIMHFVQIWQPHVTIEYTVHSAAVKFGTRYSRVEGRGDNPGKPGDKIGSNGIRPLSRKSLVLSQSKKSYVQITITAPAEFLRMFYRIAKMTRSERAHIPQSAPFSLHQFLNSLQEIDRVLVHLSHAPAMGKKPKLKDNEPSVDSITSKTFLALAKETTKRWHRWFHVLNFEVFHEPKKNAQLVQLMENVCANWSSESLGPLLYIRMLENEEDESDEGRGAPGELDISRMEHSGLATTARGVSFCIVRIDCPSPHLAIFHLAFFSAAPNVRVKTMRELQRCIVDGARDVLEAPSGSDIGTQPDPKAARMKTIGGSAATSHQYRAQLAIQTRRLSPLFVGSKLSVAQNAFLVHRHCRWGIPSMRIGASILKLILHSRFFEGFQVFRVSSQSSGDGLPSAKGGTALTFCKEIKLESKELLVPCFLQYKVRLVSSTELCTDLWIERKSGVFRFPRKCVPFDAHSKGWLDELHVYKAIECHTSRIDAHLVSASVTFEAIQLAEREGREGSFRDSLESLLGKGVPLYAPSSRVSFGVQPLLFFSRRTREKLHMLKCDVDTTLLSILKGSCDIAGNGLDDDLIASASETINSIHDANVALYSALKEILGRVTHMQVPHELPMLSGESHHAAAPTYFTKVIDSETMLFVALPSYTLVIEKYLDVCAAVLLRRLGHKSASSFGHNLPEDESLATYAKSLKPCERRSNLLSLWINASEDVKRDLSTFVDQKLEIELEFYEVNRSHLSMSSYLEKVMHNKLSSSRLQTEPVRRAKLHLRHLRDQIKRSFDCGFSEVVHIGLLNGVIPHVDDVQLCRRRCSEVCSSVSAGLLLDELRSASASTLNISNEKDKEITISGFKDEINRRLQRIVSSYFSAMDKSECHFYSLKHDEENNDEAVGIYDNDDDDDDNEDDEEEDDDEDDGDDDDVEDDDDDDESHVEDNVQNNNNAPVVLSWRKEKDENESAIPIFLTVECITAVKPLPAQIDGAVQWKQGTRKAIAVKDGDLFGSLIQAAGDKKRGPGGGSKMRSRHGYVRSRQGKEPSVMIRLVLSTLPQSSATSLSKLSAVKAVDPWALMKRLKRRINAMVSGAVLLLLLKVRPVTPRRIRLVRQLLRQGNLPAEALSRFAMTPSFIDSGSVGRKLFFAELLRSPHLLLRRVGDIYFVIEPCGISMEIEEQFNIPFWALISNQKDSLIIDFHHDPLFECYDRKIAILSNIRSCILQAERQVNQRLLLQKLHDTRLASALLIDGSEAGPEDQTYLDNLMKSKDQTASFRLPGDIDEATLSARTKDAPLYHVESSLDSRSGSAWRGMLCCKCQYEMKFYLHDRLAPYVALRKLASGALGPFSVMNRANTFVYRSHSGNVHYMKLGTQVDGRGRSLIQLRVFGAVPVSAEISEQLHRMLSHKISILTLSIISKYLARNPQFRLSQDDLKFIRNESEGAVHLERPFAIPENVVNVSTFALFVKQNMAQYMNRMYMQDKGESESIDVSHPAFWSRMIDDVQKADARRLSPVCFTGCSEGSFKRRNFLSYIVTHYLVFLASFP